MMTIGTRFTWNNYPAILKSPVMEVRNISDFPCQYLIRNTSDNSEKWMSQMEVHNLANVLSPEKALAHMQDECEADLKEIAHFYGGWAELRKVIDRLEDNDNEAAYERAYTEPGAWEGGFADNH